MQGPEGGGGDGDGGDGDGDGDGGGLPRHGQWSGTFVLFGVYHCVESAPVINFHRSWYMTEDCVVGSHSCKKVGGGDGDAAVSSVSAVVVFADARMAGHTLTPSIG